MTDSGIQRELGTITAILEQMRRDNVISSVERTKIQTSLNEVSGAIASLQADMDVVKPVTDRITRLQSVGFGVVLTVGFIAAGVGVTAATAWDWLILHLQRN